MKIALYFGSFNPIHVGHLIIANHVLTHCDIDRLWFVVSPQNLKPAILNSNYRDLPLLLIP
jgi:nicotinate-nucleotide adenylyltransferase